MWIHLIYGHNEIARPIHGPKIKVALVQGNIEQSKKWDKNYAPVIRKIYNDLTLEAARLKPDIIVWPETATPGAINRDRRVLE